MPPVFFYPGPFYTAPRAPRLFLIALSTLCMCIVLHLKHLPCLTHPVSLYLRTHSKVASAQGLSWPSLGPHRAFHTVPLRLSPPETAFFPACLLYYWEPWDTGTVFTWPRHPWSTACFLRRQGVLGKKRGYFASEQESRPGRRGSWGCKGTVPCSVWS